MNHYTQDDVEAMIKTERHHGAVGRHAVVPRYVVHMIRPWDNVLDYGCGKHAPHVRRLRELGFSHVYGYDLSIPDSKWYKALRYDMVYCSNVLNVQSQISYIEGVLAEVASLLRENGVAIFNYPQPRKTKAKPSLVEYMMRKFFHHVMALERGGSPVWKCWN